MANSFNQVTLVGNVVRNTEIRTAGAKGTPVCDNALAITDKWGDTETTTFVDLTIWGKQCENFQKFCPKGRTVLVTGQLRQDKWEDKETGAKRSKLYVNVDKFVLLGSKQDAEQREAVGAGAADDMPF